MDKLTAPLINLNGNTKDQINKQNLDVYRALKNTIEALSKTEYDNGRNATDSNHAKQMRSEKTQIIQGLKKYQNLLLQMNKEINKKRQ